MVARTLSLLVLVLSLGVSGLSLAADPTLHEVYEASRQGHVAEAQQMMRQVLKDHPESAKAHYVAAEINARAGDLGEARRELATAESIDAGLSFAKPEAVAALRRELGARPGAVGSLPAARSAPSIPWAMIGVLLLAAGVAWWLFSRRRAPQVSPAPYAPNPPYGGTVPPAGPLGYGPAAPGAGGGILGSLASGVAVGAGVVAGEELVRHMLEPERRVEPGFGTAQAAELPENRDMGGNDFGVNDADSWDSGGGGGGGGGDDWS